MMPEVEQPPSEHFHPGGRRPRDLVLPICARFISLVSVVVAMIHGRAIERMAEENARLVQANSWPFLQYVTGNQADNGDLHTLHPTSVNSCPALKTPFGA